MSKLSETLEELISFNNLTVKSFAENIGIAASTVSNYLHGARTPSIENIIKIADYFNCSVDHLLGLESENPTLTFKKCPPFPEQLDFLMKKFNRKPIDVDKSDIVSKSNYFEWKKGKRQPSLDNVIGLAQFFDCRIDFVLGREK